MEWASLARPNPLIIGSYTISQHMPAAGSFLLCLSSNPEILACEQSCSSPSVHSYDTPSGFHGWYRRTEAMSRVVICPRDCSRAVRLSQANGASLFHVQLGVWETPVPLDFHRHERCCSDGLLT